MKRVFRISEIAAAKSELLYRDHRSSIPKTLMNLTTMPNIRTTTRSLSTIESGSLSSKPVLDLYGLFADRWAYAEMRAKEDLLENVSELRDNLMRNVEDDESFEKLLEVEGRRLFNMYSDGAGLVNLLKLLEPSPHLAFKVFNWRRQKTNMRPMTPEEYTKGIKIAGKLKNLDLAVEIFTEAATKRIKNTSTYNSLMGAYMGNKLTQKFHSVFHDLKQDINCKPTTITFNMLISSFGRMVLIDQMESVFHEMKDYEIAPSVITYNNLLSGYISAWMWDKMVNIYHTMEAGPGPVQPDLNTNLLMLRGYAHSGNLEKMEEMYDIIRPQILEHSSLIRSMICAYCKSSHTKRVKRIEELVKLIPENDYKPWLNVLLIRVYAQEDMVDQMDKSIDEAFDHNTSINTVGIMKCITASYFRNNAVDRLAKFVKRAEGSGWRICRSLYHGLLCMLGAQNRIEEMEQVVVEMEKFNIGCSKKTFVILYKAYSEHQEEYKHKFHRVLGLMCKHGYLIQA